MKLVLYCEKLLKLSQRRGFVNSAQIFIKQTFPIDETLLKQLVQKFVKDGNFALLLNRLSASSPFSKLHPGSELQDKFTDIVRGLEN